MQTGEHLVDNQGEMWRSLALGFMILPILLWSFSRLAPRPAALGTARTCTQAQLIEGRLLCDEELVHDLAQHCSSGAGVLTAGDALAPGACVCDRLSEPSWSSIWGCRDPRLARMPASQLQALAQVVDINRASIDELTSLPGIGPKLAARIVEGRPYATLDDLQAVHGIGPKRLAAVRARARVGR